VLEKRTKIVVLIFLIFVLLADCVLITSGRVRINTRKPTNYDKAPIRIVHITLAQNQHDQLFEQLRKFADKHAFTIQISQTDPSGENFLVVMRTEDIEVVGLDSSDPGLFEIGLYNANEDHPIPLSVFDELVVDLKGIIREIPNVTITEKVKSLVITIEANRAQEVYSQLQKFADSHSLEFALSFSSDKSVFHVEIDGEGFHITGGNRIHTKGIDDIDISLYTDINTESANPTPIPQETLDKLFNDLKSSISEIPNVVVTEAK